MSHRIQPHIENRTHIVKKILIILYYRGDEYIVYHRDMPTNSMHNKYSVRILIYEILLK